ncbi:MAG: hypothetical protein FWD11_11415 [Micrococcales bacterium]|nr:hypothetical protein [Micrococcales bacterium]
MPEVILAREHPYADVRNAVRDELLTRLTRGGYAATDAEWSAEQVAKARIVAVHDRLRADHWFSHESAALLWGLPVLSVPDVTHLRQATRPSSHRDRAVRRYVGAVPAEHQAVVGGIPVTDLTLTMVDCARWLSGCAALVVADAALAAGADPAAADALVTALGRQRGTAWAREVLSFADAGAESAGETLLRAGLLAAGLPPPVTQMPVRTRHRLYHGDVGYPQWRIVLEYDGRTKYTDRDVLVREKRRHDAMVETTFQVLRFTVEDLHPRAILSRVLPLIPSDQNIILTPRPHFRRTGLS